MDVRNALAVTAAIVAIGGAYACAEGPHVDDEAEAKSAAPIVFGDLTAATYPRFRFTGAIAGDGYCTGTLIAVCPAATTSGGSKSKAVQGGVVLTAAHCIDPDAGDTWVFNAPNASTVGLSPKTQEWIHPLFNDAELLASNHAAVAWDVGLVRFSEMAQLGSPDGPLPYPLGTVPGASGEVVGEGSLGGVARGRSYLEVEQLFETSVPHTWDLTKPNGTVLFGLTEAGVGAAGFANGDSGAPIYHADPAENPRAIVGLLSTVQRATWSGPSLGDTDMVNAIGEKIAAWGCNRGQW